MKKSFSLSGLDCASCALSIETVLDRLPGVLDCEVHDKKSTLEVEFDETKVTPDAIMTTVRDAGFDIADA